MSNEKKKEFSLIPKIINGAIAGATGVACVFPIDLVKTRIQNQPIGPNGERMYKSIVDCFKKTFISEGFRGMYRGMLVNIILIAPEKAIKLSCNDYFRHFLSTAEENLSLTRQMLAGGLAGFCQIIVTTPMDILKIRLQDSGRIAALVKEEGKTLPVVTTRMIFNDLFEERGVFGIYKGFGITAARDCSFSAMYFPLFSYFNTLGPKKRNGSGETVLWSSLLAGLGAGMCASIVVTPFDVCVTRLQAVATNRRYYKSIIDCLWSTFNDEGFKALFKGGLMRVFVIAPLFGIAQTVYALQVAEKLLGIS